MATDPYALPPAGIATLGGVSFPLNPDQIAWRTVTKTRAQNTVGGKVVQVYGTSISEINIIGSYGVGGFQSEQAFLTQVSSWISAQVGTLESQLGQGIWNGGPLPFVFPFRNWNFDVFIVKFYNPEAAQSIFIDPRTVNYHWALTLYVASNNGQTTAADPTLDASMIKYINQLATYFGWFPNQANGPVTQGQYPTLANQSSTLTAQQLSGTAGY